MHARFVSFLLLLSISFDCAVFCFVVSGFILYLLLFGSI